MVEENPFSQEERQQKKYYNSIAGLYDKHFCSPYALEYLYWVYDLALKDLSLDGKIALDAMCGGGRGTGYLMKRGANVVGLDISEECCNIYRNRYPKANIVCSSILKTEFPNSHFDIVLTDSLHHLHPHIDEGITEIHRILKPGGYLCCFEPNSNSLLDQLRRVWYRLDCKFFEDNEGSIDIPSIERTHGNLFQTVSTIYGGNIAYLLVNCSMVFRIPISLVKIYAPALMGLEKVLHHLQHRLLSMWVLCVMRKRS